VAVSGDDRGCQASVLHLCARNLPFWGFRDPERLKQQHKYVVETVSNVKQSFVHLSK